MTPRFSPIIDVTPVTAVSSRSLASTYWLLALAMLVTAVGVVFGALFALPILASGWIMLLFLAEIALVWTAPSWVHRSPLNIVLFLLIPFLSGLTVTPFLLSIASAYANGAVLLLNAALATMCLCAAAAVTATVTQTDLSHRFGFYVFQGLIGLLVIGLLQMFIPALRGGIIETVVSGIGIVVFSIFLAIDIQRVQRMGRATSPFMMALSLYLDVFNLFLYVVRFMVATSGRRD